jgi:hypothetical protein
MVVQNAAVGFRDVDAAPDPSDLVRFLQRISESEFARNRARERLNRSGIQHPFYVGTPRVGPLHGDGFQRDVVHSASNRDTDPTGLSDAISRARVMCGGQPCPAFSAEQSFRRSRALASSPAGPPSRPRSKPAGSTASIRTATSPTCRPGS